MKLNAFLIYFAVLMISLSNSYAAPPELEVYEDEYIFQKQNTQTTLQRGEVSPETKLDQKFHIISGVNEKFKLAVPRKQGSAFTATATKRIVKYNPSKDKCKTDPISGYNCEPNYRIKLALNPDDTFFDNNMLWGLNANLGVDAHLAWNYRTGSQVIVAVIDTGTNFDHTDLSGNLWINRRETLNNIDDDNNGYVDDIHGVNFINSTFPHYPRDDNGHGTHVAGTICAEGDNGTGVVGINWDCRIMTLKFLDAQGSGSLLNAVKAVDYLVMLKQQFGEPIVVANASWGSIGYSQMLKDAIARATPLGITFVAAAGNFAINNDITPYYPASYNLDNVLSVAAIDFDGNLANFSNYGANSVDIAAPGVDIYSTYIPGNAYIALSGTSMAAPHVTGSIALLYSYSPIPWQSLINRTLQQARPWGPVNGKVRSNGILNTYFMFRPDINPTPPKKCRRTKWKKCDKKCIRNNPKGSERSKCRKKCRKKFNCPKKWHSLISDLF